MAHRHHIKGIDDRLSQSIRGQANLSAALQMQAREHERHRLESVAEMLALVGVLVRMGVLKGREAALVQGAVFQFGKGTRKDATQAAHCLPGELKLNGKSFHEFPAWETTLDRQGIKPLPLASKLRNLGGRTDLVDRDLNTTDSALEKMAGGRGLKPLYAEAVRLLMIRQELVPTASWAVVNKVVLEVMGIYRQRAAQLCVEQMNQRAITPALANGAPSPDFLKWGILREYHQVLLSPSCVPEPLSLKQFRLRVVDEVVRNP